MKCERCEGKGKLGCDHPIHGMDDYEGFCDKCSGLDQPYACPDCNGTGKQTKTKLHDRNTIPFTDQQSDKECQDCEGVGFYDNNGMVPVDPETIFEENKNYCSNCDGTGIELHKRHKSNTDEKIIDLFFERFPSYSTAVIYSEEYHCFIGSSTSTPQQLIDIWNGRYQIFTAGYKTALSKSQAEIEELKKEKELLEGADLILKEIEKIFPDWKSYRDIVDCILVYKSSSRIKELEQQINELKPMVEKSIRFYKDVLEDDGLRPYQEAEYVKLDNWTVDNWKPKE